MNIVIFGATGSIGKHLVQQALAQEHQVSAFCRDTSKLIIKHPNLIKIKGDVFNPQNLEATIKNQDVVIIALGSGNSRKSIVRSEGTQNIIAAMQKTGVQRLICQSTLGTGKSNGNLNFFWKYIMFGWFLKQVFLEHELQESYVKNSDLDWTIIRPGSFTDGKQTGKYRHGFSHTDRSIRLKIARADVAEFILKQLHSTTYLFKSPGISY